MSRRDLVIIGGGAGGPVLAQPGWKVTLFEKADKPGGDCLRYGCVPGKTLIPEIVPAMNAGAGIGAIPATIHACPTLAQIHRRAMNSWYGRKRSGPGTRRPVRWINRPVP